MGRRRYCRQFHHHHNRTIHLDHRGMHLNCLDRNLSLNQPTHLGPEDTNLQNHLLHHYRHQDPR